MPWDDKKRAIWQRALLKRKDMPWSVWCRHMSHKVCRGTRGRGGGAASRKPCECPCHNKLT